MDTRIVDLAVWSYGPEVEASVHQKILDMLDTEELCAYFERTRPGSALHDCMKTAVQVMKNTQQMEAELLERAQHDLYPKGGPLGLYSPVEPKGTFLQTVHAAPLVSVEDADNYPREYED
jgi:hypothetical protein